MTTSDWNLEANQELGYERAFEEELRRQKHERLAEAQYEEEWHERRYAEKMKRET